jgi:hypothetical protein
MFQFHQIRLILLKYVGWVGCYIYINLLIDKFHDFLIIF